MSQLISNGVDLVKVSDGLYRLGERTVTIRLHPEQRAQLQARVGTTWVAMDDFIRQHAVTIEADVDDEPVAAAKGKKKKKKAKKAAAEFDLDMDNDDAMLQTRFSHIEKVGSQSQSEVKDRRGALVQGKGRGRLTELSKIAEDDQGFDEEPFDPFDKDALMDNLLANSDRAS